MRKPWQIIRLLANKPETDGGKVAKEIQSNKITFEEVTATLEYITSANHKYHGKLPRVIFSVQKKLSYIVKHAKPQINNNQILSKADFKAHNPGAYRRYKNMSQTTKDKVVAIENFTLQAIRVNNSTTPISYKNTIGGITREVRNIPKTTRLLYLFAIVKFVQENHDKLKTGTWTTSEGEIKVISYQVPKETLQNYINLHDNTIADTLKSLQDFKIFYSSKVYIPVQGELKRSWTQHFLWDADDTLVNGTPTLTLILDYRFINDCIQSGFFIDCDAILKLNADRAKLLAIKIMSDRDTFRNPITEEKLSRILELSEKESVKDKRKKIKCYIDNLIQNNLLAPYQNFKEIRQKVSVGHYTYTFYLPISSVL